MSFIGHQAKKLENKVTYWYKRIIRLWRWLRELGIWFRVLLRLSQADILQFSRNRLGKDIVHCSIPCSIFCDMRKVYWSFLAQFSTLNFLSLPTTTHNERRNEEAIHENVCSKETHTSLPGEKHRECPENWQFTNPATTTCIQSQLHAYTPSYCDHKVKDDGYNLILPDSMESNDPLEEK